MASDSLTMVLQVFLAFVLGACIGLEREIKKSPAGIRTYAAVCLGSCLFGLVSTHPYMASNFHIEADPTRIAAQVASGVGFIGAGVIFKEGLNMVGLTTAATIWASSSVGLAVAFHLYLVAVVSAMFIIVLLNLGFFPGVRALYVRDEKHRH